MPLVLKKYKKLVKQLLFTYSELEYIEEVLSGAHVEFEKYYQQFCNENEVPVEELNKKNSEKLEKIYPKKEQRDSEEGVVRLEELPKGNPEHKVFQKMYRIIAKKLHPDKFENRERTPEVLEKIEHFKQATDAYNERNWAKFLDTCERYDILPTRYEKINSVISEEIDNTNQKIRLKKLAFSWRLYECGDSGPCKRKVIKEFLFQLFGYEVKIKKIYI
tara:strand:+ start:2273 stop:2926 length:654 start_codon:yes stop_codon:yes gene_type:complete